ncbi:MAG: DegT/DnrJ/EryC1/StrS family aminotransferase [Bacteroidetes bacterium]|nr:DegT/DnrJ/EryC1/StrS family aminotransferase [Bacteroidota bacterium]
MSWKIPLSDINFTSAESKAILEIIESGWLTMGAVTQQFEQEFATYTGAKHAVAVTNATAALHLSCLVAGIGQGDEVILPSLTFVATANAVRYTGATPIFADIESEESLNISPESIEKNISKRTRAIIVVHYGGYACDMPAIMDIANRYNLVVIEDAAHAIGSSLEKRMLGTWGQTGCFSFFSNKNMTTGEGGMIVTNDGALAEHLRRLRSHGMTSVTWDRHKGHAWSYDVVDLGYNYRLDEIRSALGRVQLSKLDSYNSHRQHITVLYREWLKTMTPTIKIPFQDHPGVSACHLLSVLLPSGIDRRQFMDSMKKRGIQTSIHYPPIHHFEAYRSTKEQINSLPATEEVAARELTLPLYPEMTSDDIELVVRSVQSSLQEQ